MIKNLLIILFFGIMVALTGFTIVNKYGTELGLKPVDTSNYNKIYSNGWYEYTFRYPSNTYIRYEQGGLPVGAGPNTMIPTDEIDVRDQPVGKGYGCIIAVINKTDKFPYPAPIDSQDIKNTTLKEFNGIKWQKLKYTTQKGDILYEYKGVKWQTENEDKIYVFQSDQFVEKWCESIISTFTFGVDKSVKTAVEAKTIKDLTVKYAAAKHPDKTLESAGFTFNTLEKGDTVGILDETTTAKLIFSNPLNPVYNESIAIYVAKQNDKWSIIGEEKP